MHSQLSPQMALFLRNFNSSVFNYYRNVSIQFCCDKDVFHFKLRDFSSQTYLYVVCVTFSACIRSIQLATRVFAGDPVKQSNNQYWLVVSSTTNIPGIVSVILLNNISVADPGLF